MSVKAKKAQKGRLEKKRIDLDLKQIDALLERAETGALEKGDYEIIKAMADCIVYLSQAVDEKAAKIKRLLRMIFGATTEKKQNVLPGVKKGDPDGADTSEKNQNGSSPDKPENEKKPNGHGRNGADDYPGAARVEVSHPDLKPGDPCPECKDGKLYKLSEPGVEIRIKGAAPLTAVVYELEKLRCNLCGILFTAPLPEAAGNKKYDASAAAMIAVLKYGSGFPFYRLAGLQANLGIPLPASTQWDIIKETSPLFKPVYQEMINQAAQGEVFFNDDTTMKVLELIKENQNKDPARKGMFTTGIVAITEERKIALFFTGRNHAGENMDKVLAHRQPGLATPIQMCDALDRNVPKEFKTILANCLIHGRRNFVDQTVSFPEECLFVIETLAEVYRFEAITKDQNMSAAERLQFHQANSGPLMDELHTWLCAQFDEKKVEPNSSLGSAIKYMLKRWDRLTAFLRIPGAPLDNNTCERALKKAILHRKNSLFFKTDNGAAAGDMFMSLIYTCELSGVNSLDYLTVLQDYSALAQTTPEALMPWNYRNTTLRLPKQG
jgi:transposase